MPFSCNFELKSRISFHHFSANRAPQAWLWFCFCFFFKKKMRRPGPRAYECVRRAWHSDRHWPIRGSIIQQIFRVVNEVHRPDTKKNKEWQEKLPIVVLRAEEIIYAKANSEAEYMNLETLWDRLNDAINTIIRRDDSNETGELLPPCIEAALNLGCIPVRASRSQRHNHPRTYLTPKTQLPSSATSTNCEQFPPPPFPIDHLSSSRPETSNSVFQVDQYWNFIGPSLFPFSHNSLPADPDLNLGSVFPLCYGKISRDEEYELSRRISEDIILLGRPINPLSEEPTKKNNICSSSSGDDFRIGEEKQAESDCDLSLRLGLHSHP